MMTDGDRERDEARNPAEQEGQNDSPVDLTGSQDVAGDYEVGQKIADTIDEEILSDIYKDADTVAENEDLQSEKVVQNDKYAEEKPITHLKNMVTKRVFPATPMIMKQFSLKPCDEHGKLVYDHRHFH